MLRISSFCLVVLSALWIADVRADEPVRLRVLSWNIHHGEGVDGRLDLERIARVIREIDPDLVALQEVDNRCTRSQGVDQAAELARLTGLHAVFAKNIPLQGGEYGNAVLSRWPIVSHQNQLLPCFENGEQRGALMASVNVPMPVDEEDPKITRKTIQFPLTFISTHFDHRKSDAERLASADAVNSLFGRKELPVVILAGDLNADPESEVLRRIFTVWTNTTKTPLPTIPVETPQKQIDFILFSGTLPSKSIECLVPDEAVASDHRAIFAVIEIAGHAEHPTEAHGTSSGRTEP